MYDSSQQKPLIASEPDFSYGSYTYSDYLKFEVGYMIEVIRGKLFKMSPAPGSRHQEVSSNLASNIWLFLKNKPCKMFSAPYDVILPTKKNDFAKADTVVQPDICVICDPSKIKERGCFGAPDWIIEIISPHSSKKDLQLKFEVYQEAGVKEYWVVMPKEQMVEVFFLENEQYKRVNCYVQEDIISSVLFPDLEITLADIFGEKPEW